MFTWKSDNSMDINIWAFFLPVGIVVLKKKPGTTDTFASLSLLRDKSNGTPPF